MPHFLCFYGHPTLSTWFTSEYGKSGKELDRGKGCVRFKKLDDLALDVRFAGRELYGGRPRAAASWSRAAGDTVLVKIGRPHRPLAKSFGVARVTVEEHMANYRAARALMGKGRNAGEGAAGLSKSSAKKGAKKSVVKQARPKK